MSLHKHLNVKSIQYLSRLIANLDMNQHNEQTLLLSALLTKNLWFLMLDIGNNNNNNNNNNSNNSKKECNKSSKLNNDLNNTKNKKKYEKQKVKIKLLNYSNKKNEKKNSVNNKKQHQQDINFAKELTSVDEFDEQNLDATSNASSTKNSIKSNCSSSGGGGGGVCRVVDDVDDYNGSRNESDEDILNAKIINGKKIMPQKSN